MTLTRGLAEASVRRFRASWSSFFAWAVRKRMIAVNPVTGTRVPKVGAPVVELHPFSDEQLEAFWRATSARNPRLADILLIAGWTGLRWSELRAIRARDFVQVPMPLLEVQRAAPEGVEVNVTKSGQGRRVPLADRVLPLVHGMSGGRDSEDLLFVTQTGHRLHASAVQRTVAWSTVSAGRRIHDLRHTAACLGLACGVDPADGSGLDGTRVDSHHEHLPPSPRNGC